jgi:hypothetical protein
MTEVILMLELQDILNRFGDDFLKSNTVCYEGIKAVNAIKSCRTTALGGHVDVCEDCGVLHISYNSCRNRNCSKCGTVKKEQWIEDRKADLLPVRYFHTVFTVPHELNPLFMCNLDLMLSILFKAASETLRILALDKKYLGANIGTTMVLHTWGQNLSFHPHVHCIVPGGGLSPSGISFIKSGKKFFIPVKVLSKVFRGKFMNFLVKAYHEGRLEFKGECEELLNETCFMNLKDSMYTKKWVVYCKKPFKQTHHIIQYLGNYTHRVAIYNNRLISMDERSVTFRYKDYRDKNRHKLMTLDAMEFIRRFLMHVLPSGFQKIRHYGILSNRNRKTKLALCQRLTGAAVKQKLKLNARDIILSFKGIDISLCKECGGNKKRIASLLPDSA